MKTNNGGPAFSRTANSGGYGAQSGMMLRDYFAAKAMQGLLAKHGAYEEDADCRSLCSKREARKREDSIPIDSVAVYAYAMADAMIKARGEA